MKKVISLSLGRMVFYTEEDAFIILQNYIEDIRRHFSNMSDSEEILSDMETRIAEHFQEEHKGGTERVITIEDVNGLIKIMGTTEDFDQADNDHSGGYSAAEKNKIRKLFRSSDDKYLGGVASGLANFVGIEPIVIRVLFVLFAFAGGFTLLVYIILWIVIPEATTATEKMQMHGEPVTLAGVDETIKKKIKESKNHNATRKLFRLPGLLLSSIGNFLSKVVFPIFGRLLGLIFTIAGAAITLGISFLFVTVLFNSNSPYIDFPLQTALSGVEYYVAVTLLFLIGFVPGLFLLLLGNSLLILKNIFHRAFVWPLIGIWILALMVGTSFAMRVAPRVEEAWENDPENQIINKNFEVSGFTGIAVGGADVVRVTRGDTFLVTAHGRGKDIERLSTHIENNILHVTHEAVAPNSKHFTLCIFCGNFGSATTIEIQMPELLTIEGQGASNISSTGFSSPDLKMALSGASTAAINHTAEMITLNLSGASRATLTGKGTTVTAKLSGASRVDMLEFDSAIANLVLSGASTLHATVTNTVTITASGASKLYVSGNPRVVSHLSGNSRVYPENTVEDVRPPMDLNTDDQPILE